MYIDALNPDGAAIRRAGDMLCRGDLVAFPTETVYGLGANALDPAAVGKIFAAKGRPSHNPLIVHVADAGHAARLVTEWPEAAQRLAERFWPGPLTLVLPRRTMIPDIVTGGGPTVAIRVPAHRVAQALLAEVGFPLAAPSANLSEQLSPTTAAHVLGSMKGRIGLILDSGPTIGGLESTVLLLSGAGQGTLLRPGLVSPAEIEAIIGPIARLRDNNEGANANASPGMMARHYAPRARLQVESDPIPIAQYLAGFGERVGVLAIGTELGAEPSALRGAGTEEPGEDRRGTVLVIHMPQDAAAYAAALYSTLHELDLVGVSRIVVERTPETDEWLAIRDRLGRASTGH